MIERLLSVFSEKFQSGGDVRVYFAPGRVNLIGEHTDYNGGHVFPCALTIGTYGVVRKRADRKLREHKHLHKQCQTFLGCFQRNAQLRFL